MAVAMNFFALDSQTNLLGVPVAYIQPLIAGVVTFMVVIAILTSMRRK